MVVKRFNIRRRLVHGDYNKSADRLEIDLISLHAYLWNVFICT